MATKFLYEKAIEDSYEGLMIRNLDGLYEINKRRCPEMGT